MSPPARGGASPATLSATAISELSAAASMAAGGVQLRFAATFAPAIVPPMRGQANFSPRRVKSPEISTGATIPAVDEASLSATSAGRILSLLSVAEPKRVGSSGEAGFGAIRPFHAISAPAKLALSFASNPADKSPLPERFIRARPTGWAGGLRPKGFMSAPPSTASTSASKKIALTGAGASLIFTLKCAPPASPSAVTKSKGKPSFFASPSRRASSVALAGDKDAARVTRARVNPLGATRARSSAKSASRAASSFIRAQRLAGVNAPSASTEAPPRSAIVSRSRVNTSPSRFAERTSEPPSTAASPACAILSRAARNPTDRSKSPNQNAPLLRSGAAFDVERIGAQIDIKPPSRVGLRRGERHRALERWPYRARASDCAARSRPSRLRACRAPRRGHRASALASACALAARPASSCAAQAPSAARSDARASSAPTKCGDAPNSYLPSSLSRPSPGSPGFKRQLKRGAGFGLGVKRDVFQRLGAEERRRRCKLELGVKRRRFFDGGAPREPGKRGERSRGRDRIFVFAAHEPVDIELLGVELGGQRRLGRECGLGAPRRGQRANFGADVDGQVLERRAAAYRR